jgi:Na+-driven multidrug efflux pump
VAALALLVPPLGAVGAALATLAGNVVAGYANIVWLRISDGMPIRDFLGVRVADLRTLASLGRALRPATE